ncbi:MAG TPA: methyltransferase domain-containing protein [Bdellovibrionota bacterium]|nr:methyltransferase domain-containing protein [Bdellovibrionota bacterium]
MIIWKLRSGGADRRFRAGHPWIYSNELASSPTGTEPGAPVELQDASGKFLARGYGNPHSLIAFRAMTRDPSDKDPMSRDSVFRSLLEAAKVRETLGLHTTSHRLCFGEADRLPGLVIDLFRMTAGRQIFVIQAHTAGANRLVPDLPELLERYVASQDHERAWENTGIILRNDIGVRKLEGIGEEPPRAIKEIKGVDYANVQVQASECDFAVNLISGQKTGFFLDQAANIQLAISRLAQVAGSPSKPVRILDLCCYVGQWGAQFVHALRKRGIQSEVIAVDASAQALDLAKRNIVAAGADCETLRYDVLKDLGTLPNAAFDIVISDPPALIKGRKDIPQGTHAYLQLNTQVFRLVRQGGGVVSCSCSALLEEESFLRVLTKAAARQQRRIRWVGRGSQSPDHPMLSEFPEGRYLKCWIGLN